MLHQTLSQEVEGKEGGSEGQPGGAVLKVAVTDLSEFIVKVQVPVPEQSPDQPEKVEPAAGMAVRVTEVPESYISEQSLPQSIPGPVTVPEPLPALLTIITWVGTAEQFKLAVAVMPL